MGQEHPNPGPPIEEEKKIEEYERLIETRGHVRGLS